MTVTLPSTPMRKNAFGAKTAGLATTAAGRRLGPSHSKPMVSATVVTEPAAFRNSRRVARTAANEGRVIRLSLEGLCGRVNRGADTGIRRATANIAAHRTVDVGIRRRRVLLEKRRRRHDLTALAIAALGYLKPDPRRLYRLGRLALQALDGGHLFTGHGRQGHYARPDGITVHVHRARTAQRHAATELGPR